MKSSNQPNRQSSYQAQCNLIKTNKFTLLFCFIFSTVLIAIQLFHRKHIIKESYLLFTQFMLPNEFYCKISLSNGLSAISNSHRLLFSINPSLISTWNSNIFSIFQSPGITDMTGEKTRMEIKNLPIFEVERDESFIQGMQYIKAICRNCKNQFHTIFDLNSMEDINFMSRLTKKSLEETSLDILSVCINTIEPILTKKQDKKMEKEGQNVLISDQKMNDCSLFISFCSSCTCFCIIPLQTGSAKNQLSCRTIIKKVVSILQIEVLRDSELQSYAKCSGHNQISYLTNIQNHLTKFKLKRQEKECKTEMREIFTFRDIAQIESSNNCYQYHKASLSASHENQFNSNLQEHRSKVSDMQNFGKVSYRRLCADPNLDKEKFAIRLQQNDETKNSYYRLKSGRKLISDRSNQNYCASFSQKQASRKGLTLRCSLQNQTIMQVNLRKRPLQSSEQNQEKAEQKTIKIQQENNKRQRNNSKRLDTQQNVRSTSTKRRRSSQLFSSSKTKKQNIRLMRKQPKKVDPLIQKLKLMKNAFEYACIRNQKKMFIQKTNRLEIHGQNQEKRTLQSLVMHNNYSGPNCQNLVFENNNYKNEQQNNEMPEGDAQEQKIEKPMFENLNIDKQFLMRGDGPLKSQRNAKQEERNNKCEALENNQPQLIDWVWECIQLKLAETIDPIAQNINFLLETFKKIGFNALKQLYLIYKKFFYMRTSLISSLQDSSQPIFAKIELSNWQQLIANSQFKQRVNKLQSENEQILKTLQKMLKKIEDKRKTQKEFSLQHNNGVWQIVIPDQDTYGLFFKQMFKMNIQIIWKLIGLTQEKSPQVQAKVPLEYFNCLILAIQDELVEPSLVKNLVLQNKSKISSLANNVRKLEAIVQANLLPK